MPRIGRAAQTFDDPPNEEAESSNGHSRTYPIDDAPPLSGELIAQRNPRTTSEQADDEGNSRYLSAEEIFAIDDIVTKVVFVPEWKTNIILISLTGAERDKYLAAIQYIDKKGRQLVDSQDSNARLLVLAARTPDGGSVFDIHQVKRLQQKNGAVVTRLANIAAEMCGLTSRDDDEDKDRREALG